MVTIWTAPHCRIIFYKKLAAAAAEAEAEAEAEKQYKGEIKIQIIKELLSGLLRTKYVSQPSHISTFNTSRL